MKILYVTDLDGTLLNTNHAVDRESIHIINGLIEKGMQFTFATARSLVSASVVTAGLRATLPVIVYNGALIINPVTREVISSASFSVEEAEEIQTELKKHDISPLVYSYIAGEEKVSWVSDRENEGMRRYLESRKGDRRLRPLADGDGLYSGNVFYYTCIGDKETLAPIYELFSKEKRFRCTLQQELYAPEYWCEIMPVKATKAEAVKKLKEICGYDRIISFGDAINDIPMFEISAECYAVAGAVPELKAISTGVIESNDHNGVANWLLKNALCHPAP